MPVLLGQFSLTFAAIENYEFENDRQQQRFKSLIKELRCLVCQNQNIADSNADLAKDLRQQIYEMIGSGQSDQDIVDFMVARYGDFVLYRPPFKQTTVLLWIGPFMFLSIALLILYRITRHQQRVKPLDEAQREYIKKLLGENDDDS